MTGRRGQSESRGEEPTKRRTAAVAKSSKGRFLCTTVRDESQRQGIDSYGHSYAESPNKRLLHDSLAPQPLSTCKEYKRVVKKKEKKGKSSSQEAATWAHRLEVDSGSQTRAQPYLRTRHPSKQAGENLTVGLGTLGSMALPPPYITRAEGQKKRRKRRGKNAESVRTATPWPQHPSPSVILRV